MKKIKVVELKNLGAIAPENWVSGQRILVVLSNGQSFIAHCWDGSVADDLWGFYSQGWEFGDGDRDYYSVTI